MEPLEVVNVIAVAMAHVDRGLIDGTSLANHMVDVTPKIRNKITMRKAVCS